MGVFTTILISLTMLFCSVRSEASGWSVDFKPDISYWKNGFDPVSNQTKLTFVFSLNKNGAGLTEQPPPVVLRIPELSEISEITITPISIDGSVSALPPTVNTVIPVVTAPEGTKGVELSQLQYAYYSNPSQPMAFYYQLGYGRVTWELTFKFRGRYAFAPSKLFLGSDANGLAVSGFDFGSLIYLPGGNCSPAGCKSTIAAKAGVLKSKITLKFAISGGGEVNYTQQPLLISLIDGNKNILWSASLLPGDLQLSKDVKGQDIWSFVDKKAHTIPLRAGISKVRITKLANKYDPENLLEIQSYFTSQAPLPQNITALITIGGKTYVLKNWVSVGNKFTEVVSPGAMAWSPIP